MVAVKLGTGLEIGQVVGITEIDPANLDAPLKSVTHLATSLDLKKHQDNAKKKNAILAKAHGLVSQNHLKLKLVDCYFSFDGSRITFVFTAESRIDFRELVKDLARNFQKSIRLQQIGIRDEAKHLGGLGHCGRGLCCRQFLGNLAGVSTDYARIQQINNRGSDRLSGICGRLMCCLSYELDYYQEI